MNIKVVIKKILRDNEIVNPILRTVLKTLQRVIKPFSKLTPFYRIYGTVDLSVCGFNFKMHSKSDDNIANEIFYNRGYEDSEFRLLKELTKTSKYFVDVGANTGIFSIYAAMANKELNILSFEPHPSNFDRLLKNISINKLTNIKVFSNALGSNNEDLEFTVPSDLSISTTASPNAGYTKNFHRMAYKTIVVKQKRIDEILLEMPVTCCDIIKVDVEYYELEVLKGAELTLLNKRPLIIIEILQYNNLVGQFPEMKGRINQNHAIQVFEFISNFGYYCYSIESSGLKFVDSLENQGNRNFLFISRKLPKERYSYHEIAEALRQLPCSADTDDPYLTGLQNINDTTSSP